MIRLFAIFTLCLVQYNAYAQRFSIRSFDNKIAELKVETAPHRQLQVVYLKDTIRLLEFENLNKAKVYYNKFLIIDYGVRGGTGLEVVNTIIILCNKDKLQVAALFNSYTDVLIGDKHKLNVFKSNIIPVKNSYTLRIDSKSDNDKAAFVNFDSKRMLFYGEMRLVREMVRFNDPLTYAVSDRKVNDLIPIIDVGTNKYFNIQAGWYKKGYNGSMFKEYY